MGNYNLMLAIINLTRQPRGNIGCIMLWNKLRLNIHIYLLNLLPEIFIYNKYREREGIVRPSLEGYRSALLREDYSAHICKLAY